MNAVDLIAHEATELPEALQAEALDFIGYLKTRHPQAPVATASDARLADLMAFSRPTERTSAASSSIGTKPMPGSFIDSNVALVAQRFGFSYYDSLIVAAAQEAGCDTVYSEDLQHGQVVGPGLTVVNPFLAPVDL